MQGGEHPIRQLPGLGRQGTEQFRLMGDHQQRHLPAKAGEQLQHLLAHRPIETGRRFIEQQHPRLPQQLHRQGQAPLLAAAEALGHLLQRQPRQPHLLEYRFRPLRRQAPVAELQLLANAEAEEMALRKLKHQPAEAAALALVQHLAMPQHLAGTGARQTGDQIEQGAFAGTAATGHQHRLAEGHRQIEAPQQGRLGRGRLIAQGTELEHRRGIATTSMPGERAGDGRLRRHTEGSGPHFCGMDVRFREIDPFSCWLWIRFAHPPGRGEREYLETLLDSWFFLGKLGAFNAESLQVHEEGVDLSWMAYDNDEAGRAQPALMHSMAQPQYQGAWARCWMDLGTSDGLGLDLLINGLRQLDHEFFEIEEVLIGGLNEDWPVEDDEEDRFLPLMDQLDRLAEQELEGEGNDDDEDDEDSRADEDRDDSEAGGGLSGHGSRAGNSSHRPRPGR